MNASILEAMTYKVQAEAKAGARGVLVRSGRIVAQTVEPLVAIEGIGKTFDRRTGVASTPPVEAGMVPSRATRLVTGASRLVDTPPTRRDGVAYPWEDHPMSDDVPNPRMMRPILEGGYIPGLDGLRAMSVCLVMISHYGFGLTVPGGLGVTIFFFISGFLITILLIQERQHQGLIHVPSFYARRFLRLGPELVVYLALATFFGMFYDAVPNWKDVAAALFYVTNYYHLMAEHAGLDIRWPHLWSLAVEEHYYLTYPALLVLTAHRPRSLLVILAGICAAAMVWRATSFELGFSSNYIGFASETRIDSIAYGCIAALLLIVSRGRLLPRKTAALLAVLGCGLLLLSLVVRGEFFRDVIRYSIQGFGLIALFIGLFTARAWNWLIDCLEVKPLRWMGRMSYAAYLWHFEAIDIYGHVVGSSLDGAPVTTRIAYAIVAIATTFLVAHLSYRLIFQPTRTWRAHFSPPKRVRVTEASQPVSAIGDTP